MRSAQPASNIKWKKGDFGRFVSESPKHPRFEVVGPSEDRQSILIWYSMSSTPSAVPLRTFKNECVDFWTLKEIVPERPPWVKPGTRFQFTDSPHAIFEQVEIRETGRVTDGMHVDLRSTPVTIRTIRRDHASCLHNGKLVFVPLPAIIRHGYIPTTVWSELLDWNPQEEPEESEEDILNRI